VRQQVRQLMLQQVRQQVRQLMLQQVRQQVRQLMLQQVGQLILHLYQQVGQLILHLYQQVGQLILHLHLLHHHHQVTIQVTIQVTAASAVVAACQVDLKLSNRINYVKFSLFKRPCKHNHSVASPKLRNNTSLLFLY
jgi:hypothetical protein